MIFMRVERAVAFALDKRGLGQGIPPLHPDTDSVHGTNIAPPSQTIQQSSSGSIEEFAHTSPSPIDDILDQSSHDLFHRKNPTSFLHVKSPRNEVR